MSSTSGAAGSTMRARAAGAAAGAALLYTGALRAQFAELDGGVVVGGRFPRELREV